MTREPTLVLARPSFTIAPNYLLMPSAPRTKGSAARHPSALNGLAEFYRVEGKLEQAEPLYEEALSLSSEGRSRRHCRRPRQFVVDIDRRNGTQNDSPASTCTSALNSLAEQRA